MSRLSIKGALFLYIKKKPDVRLIWSGSTHGSCLFLYFLYFGKSYLFLLFTPKASKKISMHS